MIPQQKIKYTREIDKTKFKVFINDTIETITFYLLISIVVYATVLYVIWYN